MANTHLIDRSGRILEHVAGPIDDAAEQKLFRAIDHAIGAPPK
jgi:hypothetical protein